MMKPKSMIMFIVVMCILLIYACQNPITQNTKTDDSGSLSPTVSFSSSETKDAAISFKADVEIYSSNNRSSDPPELINSYRLSAKTIDDTVYTRIDLSGDKFPDGNARAMISDNTTMRIVNLATMRTVGKIDLADDEVIGRILQDLPSTRTLTNFFGNADVPSLMNTFRTLSFDMATENAGEGLTVSLPASYLKKLSSTGYSYRSAKLYYDVEADTYAGMDAKIELDDDCTLTVENRPVYETIDGVLIKVGEVNLKTYDYPDIENDFETDIPQVDDIEALDVVTDAEIEQLAEEGATIMSSELILGDPNDPDYTVTEVSVYNNIEINTLDDSVFRIAE